jgi:O-antigen/teichoic acid export membrane protein
MTRSVLALYIGRLVSAGTTVVLLAVVGRLVGAEALGIVGVGMATGALLAALTEQGASMLVVRALSHRPDRARQIVGGLGLFRLVSLPIGLVVAYALLALLFPDHALAILLAAAWLAVQQATELTRAVLIWAGRAGISGLHTSIENLAWVGVMTVFLLAHAPLETAFAAGLAVLVFSAFAGVVLVRLLVGWFPAMPSGQDVRQLLRDSPPFAVFVILGQLYSRVDTLLIGALLPGGLEAAGAYFAAMRLIAGLEYLPDALTRAIYPNLARAYVAGSDQAYGMIRQDPRGLRRRAATVSRADKLRGMIRKPVELLLWISIPVPFLAFLGADWGFPLLFGQSVVGYSWVLVAVSMFVPIRFVGYLLGIVLTTGGAQARRALAVALAAALVVGLDVFLLPRIGLVAAVIALMTASVTTFGIYLLQTWRNFGLPPVGRALAEALACAGLAFVVSLALRTVAPTGIAAPAALACFGAVYLALWMVRRSGPAMLRAGKPESRDEIGVK